MQCAPVLTQNVFRRFPADAAAAAAAAAAADENDALWRSQGASTVASRRVLLQAAASTNATATTTGGGNGSGGGPTDDSSGAGLAGSAPVASNYGSNWVDLAAPGSNIWTTSLRTPGQRAANAGTNSLPPFPEEQQLPRPPAHFFLALPPALSHSSRHACLLPTPLLPAAPPLAHCLQPPMCRCRAPR